MTNWIELNPAYSTTRRLREIAPEVVEAELKASRKPKDKFETILFQPESEERKGEGGLRTKGYFKKSSEEKPLITVITVVFNGEKHLEETILSIINQNYDNVEYIIIDGGSSDGTLDTIRKYEYAIDYWISKKDKGVYDAINEGICLSLGEVVGLIHVGSALNNMALQNVSKIVRTNGNVSIIAGSATLSFDKRKKELFRSKIKSLSPRNTQVLHETLYIPVELYKLYGLYDLTFNVSADFSWVSNALRMGTEVVSTDSLFVNYIIPWGLSGDPKKFMLKINDHYRVMRRDVGLFFAIKRYLYRILGFCKSRFLY